MAQIRDASTAKPVASPRLDLTREHLMNTDRSLITRCPRLSLVLGITSFWLLCGNAVVATSATVVVNEWLIKPDLPLESYLELYNPTASTVDLSGHFLSGSATNSQEFAVAAGTVIPAGGFLVFGESQFNPPPFNFTLSTNGGFLGLFTPASVLVDGVTYGPQRFEISQGRVPDGGSSILFLGRRTPGSRNALLVTTTNDTGAGSLRQALTDANAVPGADTIGFNIPGAGPHTIAPATPLPGIAETLTVDARTQPSYTGLPVIELNGASAGPGANGLQVQAGGAVVRGLCINRFSAYGIELDATVGSIIAGCYLGLDLDGVTARPNSLSGIFVNNSPNNIVGGSDVDARNYISGNLASGILITGDGATNNLIFANFIGLDRNGSARGNGQDGVIIAAPGNHVGRSDVTPPNVISANGQAGVRIVGTGASGNIVQGNRIGTDSNGAQDLGNGVDGVAIVSASMNLIGGAHPGARNVISGNGENGILVLDLPGSGNQILGNFIGVNASGTAALSNGLFGIRIQSSSSNIIGGTLPGAGNLISGNPTAGIALISTSDNQILGNLIGTDANGTAAIPNFSGIGVQNSTRTTIGGTNAGARNIISGNAGEGISFFLDTGPNVVQGNFIGTDKHGTNVLGNGNTGITVLSSANTTIGGPAPGAGNLISGNQSQGLQIIDSGSSNNVVQGNFIGTDVAGARRLGNQVNGVSLIACPRNLIGGTTSGARNVISGNAYGVTLLITNAADNAVQGNLIGTDLTGTAAIPNYVGIFVQQQAHGNALGGTAAGAGNTIAFNQWGVEVYEDMATGTVTGNSIRRNSIFANTNAGINLSVGSLDNFRPNDSGDGDIGPNRLQNFPVITLAVVDGSLLTVAYSVDSAPANAAYPLLIEFFAADGAVRQGRTYLGTDPYSAALAGKSRIITISSAALINPGDMITATATDADGNTSEFALPFTVARGSAVTTTANAGPGSLRQAILDANFNPGPDTIVFNLPGFGTQTISPDPGLPPISSPVTIDGYTQPGAFSGISSDGLDRVISIEIYGGVADTGVVPGFHIQTSNCLVRGLVINGFSGPGLWLDNAHSNRIEGNFIGTEETGTEARRNIRGGILISNSVNNRIGGTNAAARNVISGNGGNGLLITGSGASNNVVMGNFIGTDVSGAGALGNTADGVAMEGTFFNVISPPGGSASYNRIGGNGGNGVRIAGGASNWVQANVIGYGTVFDAVLPNGRNGVLITNSPGNVIGENNVCCNLGHGILITGSAAIDNRVQANAFGALADLGPQSMVGNQGDGVRLEGAPANNVLGNVIGRNASNGLAIVQSPGAMLRNNRIGIYYSGAPLGNIGHGIAVFDSAGVVIDSGNIISDNGGAGVFLNGDAATNVLVSQNSIFANNGLGIDLGADGVTLNDPGDTDGSPNHLQNFPALTAASSGSNTVVLGTLNSAAGTTFRLEFFGNASADPSGYGEGQTFLAATNVTTDGGGNADFTFRTPHYIPPGQFVTATATDPAGNTSEFSLARQVAGAFHIGVQGGGGVTKSPDKAAYAVGENVTLTATSSQYYQFVSWSDGNSNSVRNVTVGTTNVFAALFTNTIPLETLVFKQWERTYGGAEADWVNAVLATPDGGWLVAGGSASGVSGNKTTPNLGGWDGWLLRLDSNGDRLWERVYGSSNYSENIMFIAPAGDGGLWLAGNVFTLDPVTSAYLTVDYWVARIDSSGALLWEHTFGGSGLDFLWTAAPLRDGGLLLVGGSTSGQGGDKSDGSFGGWDAWLVKIDRAGNKQWDRIYGGTGTDDSFAAVELQDGSLLWAGSSDSGTNGFGNKTTAPFGGFDIWLLQLDAAGNTRWEQAYGSQGDDYPGPIIQDADGTFRIGGESSSAGGGNRSAPPLGGADYWLLRVDRAGQKLWDRAFGGSDYDGMWTLATASGGGLVLAGQSASGSDGTKTAPNWGSMDLWLVGVDAAGNQRWDISLGGDSAELLSLNSLFPADDGWLLAGSSLSLPGGNKESPSYGTNDAWIVKLATREAPVGTPAILVNGRFHPGNAVTVSNAATVEIRTTLTGGTLLYTLDGSDPRNGFSYTGPFSVSESVLVRAIAFNSSSAIVEADAVVITVTAPPVIQVQPQSQSAVAGDTALFTVTAAGSAPLRYQWSVVQNEIASPISGATNATLGFVASVSGNRYFATVSNAFGLVTSGLATLTVLQPIVVSTQPASTNVGLGSNVTFCVVADGTGSPLFQWRRNGVNIAGATNSCLTITNAQLADGASYVAVIANAAGTQVSDPAQLVVTVPPVLPGDNFADAGLLIGATNTVSATNAPASKEAGEPRHAGRFGGRSVWYQWQAPASGIARFSTVGSTFDTLLAVYTGPSVADLREIASDDDRAGSLGSEVRFNAASNTTYSIAIDGFNAASGHFALDWELEATTELLPEILVPPADRLVPFGGTATFLIVASPAASTFQWLRNGVPIPGATGDTYALTDVQIQDIGFYGVRVTRGPRSLESRAALLEIGSPEGSGVSVEKIEDPPFGGGGLAAFQPAAGGGLALGTIGYQFPVSGALSLGDCLPAPCSTNITKGERALNSAFEPRSKGWFVVEANGSNATRTLLWACATTNTIRTLSNCDEGGGLDGRSVIRFEGSPRNQYRFWMARLDNTNAPVRVDWAFGLPPVISTPTNQLVLAGETAQLTVLATNVAEPCTGCTPMGGPDFHWSFNGRPLTNAAGGTLRLTNVQPDQAGLYTIVASNAIGTASAVVRLVVARPAPAALAVPEGGNSTFEAGLVGLEDSSGCVPSYAWLRDGIAVPGETSRILTLLGATVVAEGDYTAVVSSCAGSFTSSVVRVRVDVPFRLGGATGFGADGFGLALAGNAGQRFVIRASEDLLRWTDIHHAEMAGHAYHFTDTNAHLFLRRYYQARPFSHLDAIRFTPAGGTTLYVFAGPAGHSFVLEASTNLVDWAPVYTNYYPSPDLNFTNRDSGRDPARFYRANPLLRDRR